VASGRNRLDALATSDVALAVGAACLAARLAPSTSMLEQQAVTSILKHVDTLATGVIEYQTGLMRIRTVSLSIEHGY
jgi:hypothetical protein